VHTVITALGVTLAGRSGELAVNVGWVTTAVHMRELDAAEIEQSIARGEPFDKAGGYAIQDPELRPVRAIQGCFPNVVGLPLCAVQKMLDDPSSSGSLSPAIAPCELCRMAATELARHGYGSPDMI
ncbi:MAG: Maf family protein, partial [Chloroflexota bacterium]